MADQREFQTLKCPSCQGMAFLPLVALKHRDGGGLIADPMGYACMACQKVTDASDILRAHRLDAKREELRLLQEELGISDSIMVPHGKH